jgi:hypothetical protein
MAAAMQSRMYHLNATPQAIILLRHCISRVQG